MKQQTTMRRGALMMMALAGIFAGTLRAQNGNVGIGTTTPGSTLSVNGSLSLAHNAVTTNSFSLGDNDYYVAWNGSASGSATLPAGGASLKGRSYIVKNASTAFTLSIYPAGSGERIDGNAAVVLAPGEVATIIMNGLVPGTSGSPASTAGIAAVATGTTVAGTAPAKAWTSTGNRGTNPATDYIGTADATDFVAKTSNVERMRIQSGGNVGIGVTNPTEALHVGGSVRVNNLPAAGGTNMVTVDNDGVLRKQALPTASAPTIQGTLTTGVNLTASNWLGWNYTGASITIPANSKYVIFGTFYIAASVAPTSSQALTLRVSISDNNATFTRSADIAGAYYITGTLPPIASTTTITGNIVVNNTSNVAKTYYLFAGSAGVWGSYSATINNFGASTSTYFENGVFALPIN